MDPEIWGKHAWIFLHSISFQYPDNPTELDKQRYKTFFLMLQYILPCYKCKVNFAKHLEKHDIDKALVSRNKLIKWLIDVHNEVNILNCKKVLSHCEVLKYYNNLTNGKSYKKLIIAVCILTSIIIMYLYMNKKEYYTYSNTVDSLLE